MLDAIIDVHDYRDSDDDEEYLVTGKSGGHLHRKVWIRISQCLAKKDEDILRSFGGVFEGILEGTMEVSRYSCRGSDIRVYLVECVIIICRSSLPWEYGSASSSLNRT